VTVNNSAGTCSAQQSIKTTLSGSFASGKSSFVEPDMVSTLDSISEWIAPHHSLECVGFETKEDSLLGVLDVFCLILPCKHLDP